MSGHIALPFVHYPPFYGLTDQHPPPPPPPFLPFPFIPNGPVPGMLPALGPEVNGPFVSIPEFSSNMYPKNIQIHPFPSPNSIPPGYGAVTYFYPINPEANESSILEKSKTVETTEKTENEEKLVNTSPKVSNTEKAEAEEKEEKEEKEEAEEDLFTEEDDDRIEKYYEEYYPDYDEVSSREFYSCEKKWQNQMDNYDKFYESIPDEIFFEDARSIWEDYDEFFEYKKNYNQFENKILYFRKELDNLKKILSQIESKRNEDKIDHSEKGQLLFKLTNIKKNIDLKESQLNKNESYFQKFKEEKYEPKIREIRKKNGIDQF